MKRVDEQTLIEHVTRQRWYGAKSRTVSHSAVLDTVTIRQAEPQLTSPQEAVPVHAMLQGPRPQVRLRQLCVPLQVILHDVLPVQLTPFAHALSREHWTSQLKPSGQLTCCLHPPLSVQSIVQLR